jgi:hypothetical protein
MAEDTTTSQSAPRLHGEFWLTALTGAGVAVEDCATPGDPRAVALTIGDTACHVGLSGDLGEVHRLLIEADRLLLQLDAGRPAPRAAP